MGRLRRPSVWLMALVLVAPWLALAAGVQAEDIENRYPTPFPSVRAGWGFFADLETYLTERLPLRREAVATDAWVDVHVFGAAPTAGQVASPEVVVGSAGWLYLAGELERQCHPPGDPASTVANVRRLTSAIEGSGRAVVFAVAPDKSSIVPEHLPAGYGEDSCAAAGRAQVWESLRDEPAVGFVDLRAVLEAEERRAGVPLYLRKDTHWTALGAMIFTREAAARLDAEVAASIEIRRRAARDYVGDLSTLSGLSEVDRAPTYAFTRGAEVTVRRSTTGIVRRSTARSAAPLVEGRTLYLYDSFGEIALSSMRRTFADLVAVRLVDVDPEVLLTHLAAADNVVIEVAQRELTWHFGARFDWDELNADVARRLGVTATTIGG